ncbi:glycosyltransferase [Desulfopila aestuarii]|uniref:Glycosyltransferase, GT2 family n=1 Tax=Desulfopila aestuarii DSM 18488 TaxID=1121416 RepID=A0A1M7YI08_9BACT|nr:glycosyltransferase [Desulfopila aestuarii]SHO52251.1 Glycosyltransferase, GT2 family [Desulfopila aestuarii DSM 18488]
MKTFPVDIVQTEAAFDIPEDLSDNSAWIGHIPFAMWLVEFIRPGVVVELGTHCGDSYFAFCQSAKRYAPETRLFAVDTWAGDKHAGYYSSEIFDRVEGISVTKYGANSVLLRKTFDMALHDIEDNSVDLLHIDGLHTYEAVKHDFDSWFPKLRSGAVVLFHDTAVKRDDFGVHILWDEVKDLYPSMNFLHSSGLGVLIVGESENPRVQRLAELIVSQSFQVFAQKMFSALGHKCELLKKNRMLDEAISYAAHLEKDLQETKAHFQKDLQEVTTHFQTDISELKTYARHLETDVVDLKTRNTDLEDLYGKALKSEREVSEQLALTEIELIRLKDEIHRIYATKIWRYSTFLRKIRAFSFKGWNLDLRRGNAFSYIGGNLNLLTWLKKSWFGRIIYGLRAYYLKLKDACCSLAYAKANVPGLNRLAERRPSIVHRMVQPISSDSLPEIDLTAVVYNNSRWLETFIESLVNQDYPTSLIHLFFVDNGSTDHSLADLKKLQLKYNDRFRQFSIIENRNVGFGAGHDSAIREGSSPFVLAANIDMEFQEDSLVNAIRYAVSDANDTASWEFRQKPYEHPKYYDPVTLETSWSSHACILMRRSAYEKVGGYEKRIFMYGEDVELSYRFRDNGYRIKYLPAATVNHYTYEAAGEVKPMQFIGSTQANALIRFRYGSFYDKLVVFPLQLAVIFRGAGFPDSRLLALKNQLEILKKLPFFWKISQGDLFSFYGFDYEKIRDGSFYSPKPLPIDKPLVSIITRTYRGRERLLGEAIASVINQTYSEVEHIIVEDGGNTMQSLIDEVSGRYPERKFSYAALPKNGRSFAGNAGMEMAAGKYLLFLDDDDLLFADHIETLVAELEADDGVQAAYSLAWEVETSFQDNGDYYEHSHTTSQLFFQEFDRELLMIHNYIPIQSILFHRSLFEKFGGFHLDMEYLEDWNLWSRYAMNSTFKFVPKTTSLYRTPHNVAARINRKKHFDKAYADAVERQKQDAARYGIKGVATEPEVKN